MIVAAAYMALGRKNRDIPSVWLYMVPLYAVSALVCLAWGLIFDGLPRTLSTPDLHAIIGLALVPTICGHTILNYSMKKLSGQVVAVFNVFQFVYAGALAAFLLKEYPKPIFYVSCVLIVAGSLVALRGKPPLPRAEEFTD
jgi:drug/metabolite transporter (DMT)-like permease